MNSSITKTVLVAILALCWTFGVAQNSETHLAPKENISETVKNVESAETEGYLHVREIYSDLEKKLKSIVSTTIKGSLPAIMREVYRRDLSSKCLSSLLQLTGALRKTKLWAFQMLDACGKIPNGFLAGTLTELGNYEECVAIDVDQSKVKIKGQYCLIDIIPPMPKWRPYMSLHIPVPELRNVSAPDTLIRFISGFVHNFYITTIKTALCTPATCSKDDINKLLEIVPEMLDPHWKITVNRCETKTSFELSSVQICFMYFFILLGILVGLGTIIDLALEQELSERKGIRGTLCRTVRCFSLKTNMIAISNYTSPEDNLRFVYGLTTISVIWIMAANVFININYDIAANFLDAIRMTMNLLYQMMTSRVFPNQTLFFLGAFVTTYKWMKSPEQNLCIWKYILKAYLRYTPSYMIMIVLLMLTPAWGSGPSWMNYVDPLYENCKNNWWTNLLYVNNYVHPDKMCMKHSWFFAVAAQLHVLGLVVLIPLKRRPKIGLFLNSLLMIGSLFTVFFANMYYGIPPNEIISFLNTKDRLMYATKTYHHFHYHLMPYCAGIYAGYLIATKPRMKITPKLSYLIWLLTTAGAIAALCLVTLWSDGHLPRQLVSASYDAFSKLLWAAFILWITVSCAVERKGICYDVTSWGAFTFLSRLMFIMIIINPSITTMVFGFKKSHIFVTHFEIFYNLGTFLVCNIIAAYIGHVMVEAPLLQLNQVLKRTSGIRTFHADANSSRSNVFLCEEVISDKLPKTSTQKDVTKKKPLEKNNG